MFMSDFLYLKKITELHCFVTYLWNDPRSISVCISCRSRLQYSELFILNCAPLLVRLRDQCSILPVNTVKTVSAPPSPSASTTDKKKNEKQSRTRQKTVKVNAGISEHDLNIKMTHMSEWLEKGYNVSVFVSKIVNKPEVRFTEIVSVNLSTCGTFCPCISQ